MTIDEFKEKVAPHMNDGWVAMDEDGQYFHYTNKPILDYQVWTTNKGNYNELSYMFDIKPVEDWTKSLIEVGGKNDI